MRPRPPGSRQQGAAILIAMLILALATMVAAGFMFRVHVETRRLENAVTLNQAHWLMRAAEDWAGAILRDDGNKSSADHLDELWAKRLPPVEQEGYQLSGYIEDGDGRFNLNNLVIAGKVNLQALAAFRRLLALLALPDEVALDITDWLDADDEPTAPYSAESGYYLGLAPPYRPANRPLINVDELIRVKGVNANLVDTLRPFVTALPENTAINVNTARPEVLAAQIEGLSLDAARTLVEQRERAWYREAGDFLRALPSGAQVDASRIAVSSRFFEVVTRVQKGRIDLGSRVLLLRGGQARPRVLWRARR